MSNGYISENDDKIVMKEKLLNITGHDPFGSSVSEKLRNVINPFSVKRLAQFLVDPRRCRELMTAPTGLLRCICWLCEGE